MKGQSEEVLKLDNKMEIEKSSLVGCLNIRLFDAVKTTLTTAPLLGHPDFSKNLSWKLMHFLRV